MRKVLGVLTIVGLLGLGGLPAGAEEGTDPPAPDPPAEPGPAPQPEPAPPGEPAPAQTMEGRFVPAAGIDMRIRGTAKLIRGQRGNSRLTVHASGLEPDQGYPAHLHSGACADNGPVYSHDQNGPAEPPNALWASSDPADPRAPLQSSSSGNARGYGAAPWAARPEARSVVIHSSEPDHRPIACADLA